MLFCMQRDKTAVEWPLSAAAMSGGYGRVPNGNMTDGGL